MSAAQDLTPRQLDVLIGASMGETAAETGKRLYISEQTVKDARCAAYRRLGCRNLVETVAVAVRKRLIP